MSEREMAKLLALIERALGASWLDISDWLREQNDLDSVASRLLAGDYVGAIAEVEAAALHFAAETQDAYVRAGTRGARWLNDKLATKLVQFDVDNERVVRHARLNKLELVGGFQDEANQIAQQITHRAMVEGTSIHENPRLIARQFRDSIGLLPHQEAWVHSYRRALEDGDWSNALGRELRDTRSDRLIRRLRKTDGRLSNAQISKMVERYRKAQIASRAENIARTESQRNVHEALEEMYDQAVTRGDVDAAALIGEWIPGPKTKHARDQHRSLSLLDQRPKHGEDFVMSDGVRMRHPGDRRGGAKHCARCRCTKATRLIA